MDQARFLNLDQVAEILATSRSQAYALVRGKTLRAVKIGGRGQWRIERTALEDYIATAYRDTDEWLDKHPFTGTDADE